MGVSIRPDRLATLLPTSSLMRWPAPLEAVPRDDDRGSAEADRDGAEADGDEELAPADALSLPAHEIRVGILETLWDAEGHALPYAELRKRVGVRDSGQFNYHLSKLDGRLIGHTDDEYHLVYPGHRLLDAVQSGAIQQRIDPAPRTVEGACALCDGALELHYEDYHCWVTCTDCDAVAIRFPFDPAGIATTDTEDLPVAFDRSTRSFWRALLSGVCPSCSSPVRTELAAPDAPFEFYDAYFADGQPALIGAACEHCSIYGFVPVGVLLLTHPAAVGWLYDRGVDVRNHRLWQLPFVVAPDAVTATDAVGDRDDDGDGDREPPTAVAIEAHAAGQTLRAIVDESATITSLERP